MLETALAVALLDRVGGYPAESGAMRGFLRQGPRAGTLTGVERALARAVLEGGTVAVTDALVEEVAAAAPHFTAGRKRALVQAFATAVDERFLPGWDGAAFDRSGLHAWAVVQMTASKVILAHATGNTHAVDDEDARILLDTQRGTGVWEGNVLLHLSALHALSRLPGTGRVVTDGVRAALEQQRADGGLPFVTDTDTWVTATAGIALASAGAPRDVLHRLASHLVGRQLPGGGWSYTDASCQADVDDTSVAVQFLHVLDAARYEEAIMRGIRSMTSVAGPDGGFPTYRHGAPSEPCMTAAVVDALTLRPAGHEVRIRAGLDYLAELQCPDGFFPPDWSSSTLHTVFRVLLAASRGPGGRSPGVERMAQRALGAVLSRQNPDGGWGMREGDESDVLSTAYGLIAVCGQDDPGPARGAVSFLMAAEHDGGVRGALSDSIGPRPFVFTVPVLADVFTVLALGHLAGRTAPAPLGPGRRLAVAR
ncbi:prenyltransferase/squalene oxidase repeat-containing protein [Streptomyces sp. HF10]|uniref:prenyltransferase/squalene oxidase repeat-containing protein n=1 Tax=Streptomyces sp. HF10 TaxID=2692233 RepID=UPI00131840FF|nr:prenyltransferase/squalene oxidase repeat-containing protein [Streptomyces sp. HF10]QHC27551.1 hypothetical protein GR129_00475 [Streptomyces sp. HF10]